jgi:Na+/proline symporter
MEVILFLVMVSEIPLALRFFKTLAVTDIRIKWTLRKCFLVLPLYALPWNLCLCFSLFATFFDRHLCFSENALWNLAS